MCNYVSVFDVFLHSQENINRRKPLQKKHLLTTEVSPAYNPLKKKIIAQEPVN